MTDRENLSNIVYRTRLQPHPDGALLTIPKEIAPPWWQPGQELTIWVDTADASKGLFIIIEPVEPLNPQPASDESRHERS